MTSTIMPESHQTESRWWWSLEPHQAATLPAAVEPRALVVQEGRVWLTREAAVGGEAEDIWLEPGQSLEVPAGTAWVLEGWPQARVSLVLAAPAALSGGPAPWWRAVRRRRGVVA